MCLSMILFIKSLLNHWNSGFIVLKTRLLEKNSKLLGYVSANAKAFILGILKLGSYCMRLLASAKSHLAMHRLLPLRQRYLMTRGNRLRLRYISGAVAVCFLSAGFATSGVSLPLNAIDVPSFSMASNDEQEAPLDVVANFSAEVQENVSSEIEEVVTDAAEIADAISRAIQEEQPVNTKTPEGKNVSNVLKAKISDGIRKASLALKKPEQPRFKEVEVASGQTVAGLLQDSGLSGNEAYYAVKALQRHYDVRKVKSGQKIGLHYEPDENGSMGFKKLEMKLSPVKMISITRAGPKLFTADIEELDLVPKSYARKASIKTSLYGSAALAGIPQQIVAEIIRIYSWDIDFQRDLRRGDKIEVMYQTYETEDGEFARYGDILYANLSVRGKDMPIYRYEMNNGSVDFFQPNGMSIRKTLMKTPVDGARISSGFGMRRHPVLGYNKMHKGVDFSAPTGTPIYAAGDGTVEYAGRNGGYGNYIRLRHNSKLKTAYAHLHKFKRGLKSGMRVEQGEVIGYVGTTGRSTGPHLHYEVLMAGRQVNPRSVDVPTGEQLNGKELERFKSIKGAIFQEYAALVGDMKFALAE